MLMATVGEHETPMLPLLEGMWSGYGSFGLAISDGSVLTVEFPLCLSVIKKKCLNCIVKRGFLIESIVCACSRSWSHKFTTPSRRS